MNEYEKVLKEWASAHLYNKDAVVTSVDVVDDPGYRYSSYTFEDPHVDIYVNLRMPDGSIGRQQLYGAVENMGDLLTQLFAIADKQ